MGGDDGTLSKGEFAAHCGVTPGRVTQWISGRILSGAAIVGEGRSARIRTAVALEQVKLRRDPGQANGNGLGTKLDGKAPPPKPPRPAPPPGDDEDDAPLDVDAASADQLDIAIKRAKLRGLQSAQRETDEKEAARQGRFVEASAVSRQMGIVATQTMRVFEGALPEVATALAARFDIDNRELLQALTEAFRGARDEAAKKARAAAEAKPALVVEGAGDAAEA